MCIPILYVQVLQMWLSSSSVDRMFVYLEQAYIPLYPTVFVLTSFMALHCRQRQTLYLSLESSFPLRLLACLSMMVASVLTCGAKFSANQTCSSCSNLTRARTLSCLHLACCHAKRDYLTPHLTGARLSAQQVVANMAM